jgi:hypothetical protein
MGAITPVFIVGTTRSGTTITRVVLSVLTGPGTPSFEPRILLGADHKTGLAVSFWKDFDDHDSTRARNLFFAQFRLEQNRERGYVQYFARSELASIFQHATDRLIRREEEAKTVVRECVDAVFGGIAARQIGAGQGREFTHWIDDTPAGLHIIPEILEMWPNAKIVHSIRDGRLVADSFVQRGWSRGCWQHALQTWLSRLLIGRALGAAAPAGSYMEVDFGQSARDPTRYFSALADFIGVGWDPRALRAFDSSRAAVPRQSFSGEKNSYFRRLAGPIAEEFGWE